MRVVNSLEEYINIIREYYLCEGSAGIDRLLYRGQSDIDYNIIPSLSHGINGDDDSYKEYEKDIIERAQLDNDELFVNCVNHIDKLAVMQHYGLPTRLLDVTESPLVALFFACNSNNKKDKDGEVFLFKTACIGGIVTSFQSDDIIKKNGISFVRAKYISSRQKAQQGLFMWIPDKYLSGVPKDEKESDVLLESIKIPSICKSTMLNDLKMLGITTKTLFPDNVDMCFSELLKDITKNAFSA